MCRNASVTSVVHELKRYRPIQLQVAIFNEAFAYVIYTLKLMCLALIIFGLSFSVRFHVANPAISGNSTFYGVYTAVLFIVFYDKVFEMPEKINNFKRNAILAACGTPSCRRNGMCKIIRLTVTSIPAVGIKVGGFGYLERQSTPIFMDFNFRGIFTILIALHQ